MVSIAVERQLEEMLGTDFPRVAVAVASWLRKNCKLSHGDTIRPQDVAEVEQAPGRSDPEPGKGDHVWQ